MRTRRAGLEGVGESAGPLPYGAVVSLMMSSTAVFSRLPGGVPGPLVRLAPHGAKATVAVVTHRTGGRADTFGRLAPWTSTLPMPRATRASPHARSPPRSPTR